MAEGSGCWHSQKICVDPFPKLEEVTTYWMGYWNGTLFNGGKSLFPDVPRKSLSESALWVRLLLIKKYNPVTKSKISIDFGRLFIKGCVLVASGTGSL